MNALRNRGKNSDFLSASGGEVRERWHFASGHNSMTPLLHYPIIPSIPCPILLILIALRPQPSVIRHQGPQSPLFHHSNVPMFQTHPPSSVPSVSPSPTI